MSEKWKKSWKSSKKPKKQRKYRANAPYHLKNKFLSAKLSDDLKNKVGTGTLPIRVGDKTEIMRGEYSGISGKVEEVDYDDYKVYLDSVDRERVDGTEAKIPLDPSNLKITKLELEDERRLEKYDVSEEEKQDIKVKEEKETEEEEVEEEEKEAEKDEENSETEKEDTKREGEN